MVESPAGINSEDLTAQTVSPDHRVDTAALQNTQRWKRSPSRGWIRSRARLGNCLLAQDPQRAEQARWGRSAVPAITQP